MCMNVAKNIMQSKTPTGTFESKHDWSHLEPNEISRIPFGSKSSEVTVGLFLTEKPQEVKCASRIHNLLVTASTKVLPTCLNAYC